MFEDKRSKIVIPLVHCVANQNSRVNCFGRYPGPIPEVIGYLMEKGVGILQLPCPELQVMGLKRKAPKGEPTDIMEVMGLEHNRHICRNIAENLTYQIKQYLENDFFIPCVIGSDGSPTCGVHITLKNGNKYKGSGIFIQELEKVFDQNGITVPIIACADAEDESGQVLDWLKQYFGD